MNTSQQIMVNIDLPKNKLKKEEVETMKLP